MMLYGHDDEIVGKASGATTMQTAHSQSQPTSLSQPTAPSQTEVTSATRPSGDCLSFFVPLVVLGTFFAVYAVAELVNGQAKNLLFVCIWAASFSYILLGTCGGICGLAVFRSFKFLSNSFRKS
jgi:hypothetical protein